MVPRSPFLQCRQTPIVVGKETSSRVAELVDRFHMSRRPHPRRSQGPGAVMDSLTTQQDGVDQRGPVARAPGQVDCLGLLTPTAPSRSASAGVLAAEQRGAGGGAWAVRIPKARQCPGHHLDAIVVDHADGAGQSTGVPQCCTYQEVNRRRCRQQDAPPRAGYRDGSDLPVCRWASPSPSSSAARRWGSSAGARSSRSSASRYQRSVSSGAS